MDQSVAAALSYGVGIGAGLGYREYHRRSNIEVQHPKTKAITTYKGKPARALYKGVTQQNKAAKYHSLAKGATDPGKRKKYEAKANKHKAKSMEGLKSFESQTGTHGWTSSHPNKRNAKTGTRSQSPSQTKSMSRAKRKGY